ncbi:MAG: tetratricopeptide repeat protein, partial [Thermodesulfovibrionales bacterium]|nr:tetratricopeptide repeat protein [Thermodesulfovibrionales bacterium]
MSEARELFRKGKESIKKNWIRAYQYFLEAKNSDPSFIPVYSEIADLLYKRGFVKEAFSVIEEGMKVKPDDQMLLFAMANLYLSTGKPGPALRYYHRLYKELDNPPADIYFLMGLCHSLLGHYRKALALVKRAITMDHYLFEAHDLYGRLCIETGKYEEAESSYRYILQFDSEDSHAHYMLG